MTEISPAPKRRRRGLKITLGILGVILLGAVATGVIWAVSVASQFDNGTEKIEQAFPDESLRPAAPTGEAAAAQNILLLGSDTRGTADDIDDLEGQRSDTMMVVHVPADRQNVTVMSIMRDSWVDIPGHGEAKVNAALSYGGVPLAVQTVETIIGARIDHVAIIDFEGFKGLTDALGGVDVNNPIAFESSHIPGHVFDEGVIHLNGDEGLAFTRERYAFSDGDYQRVRNQQAYLRAVINTFLSRETLTNPARIGESVGAIAPFLTVDRELTSTYAGGLGLELRDVRGDDIAFFTLPTTGTGTSADGQSIVLLDEAKLPEVQAAFQGDTVDEYAANLATANAAG